MSLYTVSAGFNEFGLTNHLGLINQFLTENILLLHKKFGFGEFPVSTHN